MGPGFSWVSKTGFGNRSSKRFYRCEPRSHERNKYTTRPTPARANHRSSGASTTRKRGSTPAFRCTTRVLGYDGAFSSKGSLRPCRPSLAWLDFAREHAVARAQHPKNTRGSKIRARPREGQYSGFCGPVFGPAFAGGATSALLSGFRFFASNSGCQIHFFCACCRQARQPAPREVRRISRRLVDAPDGHTSLVITLVDHARMDHLAAASQLTRRTAPAHCWQRGLAQLRREYPPKFGQQSTIGRFAISETHPLIS